MKIKISRNSITICLFFALLVLSNTIAADIFKIISVCEAMAYAFLLGNIILLCLHKSRIMKNKLLQLAATFLFFSVGIVMQDMTVSTKLKLLFTMWAIALIAIVGGAVTSKIEIFRKTAYTIFVVSIIVILLSGVLGINMMGVSQDHLNNYSSIAFNGGIVEKNFFASNMLSSFIGLYCFRVVGYKKRVDKFILTAILGFILLSGSRGTWVLLVFFLTIVNFSKIRNVIRNKRIRWLLIGIISGLALCIGFFFYNNYVSNSYTYSLRINGFVNYWNLIKSDPFSLFLGYAEHMYVEDIDYNVMFKTIFGKFSSAEIAFLNMHIKSGLCGIIGFLLIFIDYFTQVKKMNDKYKAAGYAVMFTLLLSAFVETYLVSIHLVFGIYCYLIIAGLCEINKSENLYKGIA